MRVKIKIWDKDTVKQLRANFNISQELFAAIIGTRQQTISEWEKGMYKPHNAYIRVLDAAEDELKELYRSVRQDDEKFAEALYERFGGTRPERAQRKRVEKDEIHQE